jgi:hypothetical protein
MYAPRVSARDLHGQPRRRLRACRLTLTSPEPTDEDATVSAQHTQKEHIIKRKIATAVVAIASVIVLTSAVARGASPTTVSVESYGGPFAVEPAQIVPAGDGALFIAGTGPHYGRIDWSDWTFGSAYGTGVVWGDDCDPNCAAGTYHGFRVRIWLWRPALVNGREIFTRLRYAYRYNVPRNAPPVVTLQYGTVYGHLGWH